MMKEARKRQIVLILILSVLVLVCLIVEAGREEVKDHKTKIVSNRTATSKAIFKHALAFLWLWIFFAKSIYCHLIHYLRLCIL